VTDSMHLTTVQQTTLHTQCSPCCLVSGVEMMQTKISDLIETSYALKLHNINAYSPIISTEILCFVVVSSTCGVVPLFVMS